MPTKKTNAKTKTAAPVVFTVTAQPDSAIALMLAALMAGAGTGGIKVGKGSSLLTDLKKSVKAVDEEEDEDSEGEEGEEDEDENNEEDEEGEEGEEGEEEDEPVAIEDMDLNQCKEYIVQAMALPDVEKFSMNSMLSPTALKSYKAAADNKKKTTVLRKYCEAILDASEYFAKKKPIAVIKIVSDLGGNAKVGKCEDDEEKLERLAARAVQAGWKKAK